MKLTSFKYFPYTLNFHNQFKTSGHKFNSRKIFLVELVDENHNKYYGEIAPLPEFNSENFEDVENELQKLLRINEFESGDSLEHIFEIIDSLETFPMVQYSLEQIFINALLKRDVNVIDKFFDAKEINVNAVMGIDDFESSQKQLENIIEQGYRTVKIKTGNDNFEDLYELLTWAVGEVETKIRFRIDPNSSWSKKDTLLRCERLDILPIEYIEQPVKESKELIEVAAKSPIPIAADESVRNLSEAEKLVHDSKIKFLVIKPMLFGGLSNLSKLKNILQNRDVKIIVSSSLESNIGKKHLVLSALLTNNSLAHGLGTSELFSNQPIEDVFPVKNGKINFTTEKYLSEFKLNL